MKKLFDGILGNQKLFDMTVSSTKQLFDGLQGSIVPPNNKLFDRTVYYNKAII